MLSNCAGTVSHWSDTEAFVMASHTRARTSSILPSRHKNAFIALDPALADGVLRKSLTRTHCCLLAVFISAISPSEAPSTQTLVSLLTIHLFSDATKAAKPVNPDAVFSITSQPTIPHFRRARLSPRLTSRFNPRPFGVSLYNWCYPTSLWSLLGMLSCVLITAFRSNRR